MGLFGRLANLWRGFLSLFIEGLETQHPELVYESAIEEKKKQFHKLRDAVAGIVRLRNKYRAQLKMRTKELKEIQMQIPLAVEKGEDEVALTLIEQKNRLSEEVDRLKEELERTNKEAEDAKASLISFESEIHALKKEKDLMIARKQDAEARLTIQDSLSGLSTTSSMKALDNVRESIERISAEADVAKEIADGGLSTKLREIKKESRSVTAKAELEEIKKQISTQKTDIKKTMG